MRLVPNKSNQVKTALLLSMQKNHLQKHWLRRLHYCIAHRSKSGLDLSMVRSRRAKTTVLISQLYSEIARDRA